MTESADRVHVDRSMIGTVIAQLARIDRNPAVGRCGSVAWRVCLNVAVVLALVGAVVTLLVRVAPTAGTASSSIVLFMAGLAASGGTAAALMLVFAAWLTGDSSLTWIGLIVGWYCLLAIPLSVVRGFDAGRESLPAAALVLVLAVAVVLWVIATVEPAPPTGTRLLQELSGVTTLVVAAAVVWTAASPGIARAVANSPVSWTVAAVVWIAGGLVVVVRATLARIPDLALIGAGLAILGADHVGRVVLSPSDADAAPLLATLRLLAVTVVLGASLWLLRRTLLQLSEEQTAQEEELRDAELRLARAAERDHDLRNGLAGLAGATAVLGGGTGTDDLGRVVASELHRLEVLLAGPADGESGEGRRSYEVAPALEGLMMLRRSAGMDVRADVEPGLRALGAPSALAQVVINLLANAERHAPGSPVRLCASQRAERVEIRVRDFGPGVPVGREREVLEAGARDESAGGLGLGLHVCRMLLHAEGATIDILPADPRSPGCVVVIGLRSCPPADAEGPRQEHDALRVAP